MEVNRFVYVMLRLVEWLQNQLFGFGKQPLTVSKLHVEVEGRPVERGYIVLFAGFKKYFDRTVWKCNGHYMYKVHKPTKLQKQSEYIRNVLLKDCRKWEDVEGR